MFPTEQDISNLSIYHHVIKTCNTHCAYCFAMSRISKKRDRLSSSEQKVPDDTPVEAQVRNFNFNSGESTLVRIPGDLCERIKPCSKGNRTVSFVSNGA